eukprot:scaffold38670_cov50-Attheya_sp.AAC.3
MNELKTRRMRMQRKSSENATSCMLLLLLSLLICFSSPTRQFGPTVFVAAKGDLSSVDTGLCSAVDGETGECITAGTAEDIPHKSDYDDDDEYDEYEDSADDLEEEEEVQYIKIPKCPNPQDFSEEKCMYLVKHGGCHQADESSTITHDDLELEDHEDPSHTPSKAGLTLRCCAAACVGYDASEKRVLGSKQQDEMKRFHIGNFLVRSEPQKFVVEDELEEEYEGKKENITASIELVLEEMQEYMEQEVSIGPEFDNVREKCINRHPLCAYWAATDGCDDEMLGCAPACKKCLDLSVMHRCPRTPGEEPAYKPGDLHAMFKRIEAGDWDEFEPTIVMKPESSEVDDKPWVVTFDNFLTDEECDALIKAGYEEGYERSMDVGEMLFDGTFDDDINDDRTSENAWCDPETCEGDPLIVTVNERIANVTGIPYPNAEYLQLLRYELGQKYDQHHDYIDSDDEHPVGHRMLTFFLYLSDVEEGGETYFNKLKVKSPPRKGKALLWPSVLNSDPSAKDHRTDHQALPVIKGKKYAANAWLHQYDFKGQWLKGCG